MGSASGWGQVICIRFDVTPSLDNLGFLRLRAGHSLYHVPQETLASYMLTLWLAHPSLYMVNPGPSHCGDFATAMQDGCACVFSRAQGRWLGSCPGSQQGEMWGDGKQHALPAPMLEWTCHSEPLPLPLRASLPWHLTVSGPLLRTPL